jgi:hypothetical protein
MKGSREGYYRYTVGNIFKVEKLLDEGSEVRVAHVIAATISTRLRLTALSNNQSGI